MTSKPFVLFFAVLLLVVNLSTALHYKCDANKARSYKYIVKVDGLGGSRAQEKKLKQKTVIVAQVQFQCLKSFTFHSKRTGLLYMAQVKKITMQDTIGKKPFDVTKDFAEPIFFSISINGNIHKVYQNKKDDPWVVTLKKSIISHFHTKIHGAKRKEITSNGLVMAHYDQATVSGGGMQIRRIFSEKDILKPANDKIDISNLVLDSKDIVTLDVNGNVIKAERIELAIMGSTSKRRHAIYKNMRKYLEYQSKSKVDYESSDNRVTQVETVSELIFLKPIKASTVPKSAPQVQDGKEHDQEDTVTTLAYVHDDHETHETAAVTMSADVAESEMQMDDAQVMALYEEQQKNWLKDAKIGDALNKIASNPSKQLKLYSQVLGHIKFNKESVPAVYKSFETHFDKLKSADKKAAKKIEQYLRMCQTMMLVVVEGQAYFLKTLKNPSLIGHGIRRASEVEQPTAALIAVLRQFTRNAKGEHTVSENAYLALATLAPRMEKKQQRTIVKTILKKFNRSSNKDKEFHLHAMGNAGDSVPLELIKKYIISKNVSLKLRLAALLALRKRFKQEQAVAMILNTIAKDKKQPIAIRVAAIAVQTQREQVTSSGSSLATFANLLKKDNSKEIRDAATQYYYENGSDMAAEMYQQAVEDDTQTLVDFSFVEDLGTAIKEGLDKAGDKLKETYEDALRAGKTMAEGAKNAFENVGNKIADGTVKLGETIKSEVVDKIADGLNGALDQAAGIARDLKKKFAAARFTQAKTCLKTGIRNEMCLYNSDMISYVQKQGDLSRNAASGFAHESLLGAESLNVYIGAVGYVGTNLQCSKTNNYMQFNAFLRGSLRASFFGQEMNLIQAAFQINQRTNVAPDDRIYVQIGPTVFLDKRQIGSADNCLRVTKNVYEQEFANVLKISYSVVIVAVPATFSFSLGAKIGVDLGIELCAMKNRVVMVLEPYLNFGITASAALGFKILTAAIEISMVTGYRLQPNFGLTDCKLCAKLDHAFDPLTFTVSLIAKTPLLDATYTIYEYALDRIPLGNLYTVCSKEVNIELGDKSTVTPTTAANGKANLPAPLSGISSGKPVSVGTHMYSSNGLYDLHIQDGNIVLNKLTPVWNAGTVNARSLKIIDGRLVLLNAANNEAYATGETSTNGPFTLKIENNGNMYVADSASVQIWGKNAQRSRLCSGSIMPRGQTWYSQNRRYWLVMQFDGNLVLYLHHRPLFSSSTWKENAQHFLYMHDNGNLVMYDQNGNGVWQTNSVQDVARGPFCFEIGNNGNLNILAKDDTIVWSTNTKAKLELKSNGDRLLANQMVLTSPNGRFDLIMQSDGNLAKFKKGVQIWSTGTNGQGAFEGSRNHLIMQDDGNLVMYDAFSKAIWKTDSEGDGKGPFTFLMQNDGNAVIYDSQGKAIWASGTEGVVAAATLSFDEDASTMFNEAAVLANSDDDTSVLSSPIVEDGLPSDSQLLPGEHIYSKNGAYELTLRADTADLVEYLREPIWRAFTTDKGPNIRLAVLPNGGMVIYDAKNVVIWSTNTFGVGVGPFSLQVEDNGTLVLYDSKKRAIWSNTVPVKPVTLWK